MNQLFYGIVRDGKLTLEHREHFDAAIRTMAGDVELELRPRRFRRSDNANKRYWAILNRAAEATGHTSEELHEIAKSKFNTGTKEVLGQVYEYTKSTALMDSRSFKVYVDTVERWLLEQGV